MKCLKLLLCALFVAAMLTVPTGCGSGGITELKPQEAPPAGHNANVTERSKAATEGTKAEK